MARTIRFIHHYDLYGHAYIPGDVVTVDDREADMLIASQRAVDPGAPAPPVTYPDPLPQYVEITDLDDPATPAHQKLSATYAIHGTADPSPGLPSGTEYVWFQTDGAGNVLDILSGVKA